MKNTQKGFTLVELLVVIAILAILATVSVVGYTSFIGQADKQAAETEAEQIKTTIDSALTLNKFVRLGDDTTNVTITRDATTKKLVVSNTGANADNTFKATDIDATMVGKISTETVSGKATVVYQHGEYYVDLNTGKLVTITPATPAPAPQD